MNKLKLGFCVSLVFALLACDRDAPSVDEDYEVLSKESVSCEPPARMEIQSWGKNGLSRSCKLQSGPFLAAENGYVHFRGQYKAGKEVGIWRWYDKEGNIVKEIDYSADQSQ